MDPIWTEVDLALPEKGETVLAWAPDGKNQIKNVMEKCFFDGRDFSYGGYYTNQLEGVTHWLQMPSPPTEI